MKTFQLQLIECERAARHNSSDVFARVRRRGIDGVTGGKWEEKANLLIQEERSQVKVADCRGNVNQSSLKQSRWVEIQAICKKRDIGTE